ncbi:MAG: sulfurtransferase [Acidimicrobiales bacterium]
MIPPFVEPKWLEEHRDQVVLADVRWYLDGRSGRDAYNKGHLPGAVFVDLDQWLAGDPTWGRGRHPLPDPETFATGMSAVGIGDDSIVVAYDDQCGVIAARLVWMLRATGHDAACLDGGLCSNEPLLETAQPAVETRHFTARSWPRERLATIEDASDPSQVVIDARPAERYRGDVEPVDRKAGHIPGARSLPCRANLDEIGRLLESGLLLKRFKAAGVSADTPVVSYCGSGVTACHNLLVLERCGLGHGRLYPGSWSEYSSIPDMPIEQGDPHPVVT